MIAAAVRPASEVISAREVACPGPGHLVWARRAQVEAQRGWATRSEDTTIEMVDGESHRPAA